jgi:hypothetical protein
VSWVSRLTRRRTTTPPPVVDDPTVFIAERLDLESFRVEGLREALADAQRQLAAEKAARAVEVGQLKTALAVALLPSWMASNPAIRSKRLDDMPTSVVPASLIRRAVKGRHR